MIKSRGLNLEREADVVDGEGLSTPVLFLVFNRPQVTARVFAVIREARPRQLFIAMDGPRADVPTDVAAIAAVRRIVSTVDWPCEVKTLFRDKNLGCKFAVSSAIDWFFKNVEEGIILEDDCLPNLTFFKFCKELLLHYRNDARVMHISGNNFQFGFNRTPASYYFSKFPHIWGWATWRRAWHSYDVKMERWSESEDRKILFKKCGGEEIQYWTDIFNRVYRGDINTWDYQWTFACWLNNGVSILPAVNLVTNIGFGGGSTHTKSKSDYAEVSASVMKFPLRHPMQVEIFMRADQFAFRLLFSRTWLSKIFRYFLRGIKNG